MTDFEKELEIQYEKQTIKNLKMMIKKIKKIHDQLYEFTEHCEHVSGKAEGRLIEAIEEIKKDIEYIGGLDEIN